MKPDDIFTCRMCGDCCRGYGGTYVSTEEIAAIARHIGCDPDRFEKEYCQRSGNRRVIAQQEGGYCIFWDEKCTIHPVKPAMCRAWPFIRAVLVDPGNWYAMADSCPGMRTNVSGEEVCAAVQRALEAPPNCEALPPKAATGSGSSAETQTRLDPGKGSGG